MYKLLNNTEEEASILPSDLQWFVYLLHLGQLSPCMLIVPQVLLVPHQDDRNIGTEVFHLRRPLLRDIFCPEGEKKEREVDVS